MTFWGVGLSCFFLPFSLTVITFYWTFPVQSPQGKRNDIRKPHTTLKLAGPRSGTLSGAFLRNLGVVPANQTEESEVRKHFWGRSPELVPEENPQFV